MADDFTSNLKEESATADSVYGAYLESKKRGIVPSGYGSLPRMHGDPPDADPLGVASTQMAESGRAPLTSNTVMGLYVGDNSWVSRDELMQTPHGRKLVQTEEDLRRGRKKGFFDTLFQGPLTDFVPFLGMFGKTGGSIIDAGEVNDAYDKLTRKEQITKDQAIKLSLYERENVLNSDPGFGAMFAGIVRQAPAFFAEFGMLGKVGQVARGAIAARTTAVATDAAAKSASRWALSQATKIGADEYAEMAVRSYAEAAMKGTTKSFGTVVRELSENPTLRKQTLDAVAANVEGLVEGAANSVARVDRWAPGLMQKVARVRAETALDSALTRMSTDSKWMRFWNGLKKSTADAAVSGLTDLGSWGTEAGSVINTGYATAGKAALDAVTGLTVGAAARGSALFLPRTAVTETISAATGAVGAQTLALKSAAYNNDDDELMSRADKMGMFLDWMEYVSENTGRGFNGLFRAAGLKLFPKLVAPASRVAGTTHITGAKLTKDAAGAVTGVEYTGLVEAGRRAEVGGAIRRFCEKRFGGKALRDDVANDQFKAVSAALSKKGIRVDNPAALQATLTEGSVQPGVSAEIAAELGNDVRRYTSQAVKAANAAGVEGMKIRGFQMYYIADFMARHNLDPVSTMDAFSQMGYDGIIGEMLEERYSDVVTALAGANAEQKQGFFDRLKRATNDALMLDDEGRFKWNQFVAEASGFAVPLVARGMVMRGLSTIGSPNRWQKHRDWSASYADATRYNLGIQWKLGDYLAAHEQGVRRFSKMATDARAKYTELKNRGATAEGTPVDQAMLDSYLDTERRARTAVRRLGDIKKSFIESLSPTERADSNAIVNAPMVTDTDLMSPEEAYNLRTRPGEGDMRQAMAAYRTLVENAAESGQMLYQSDHKTAEEDEGWFRRVSRQVGSAALRLAGTAVTGDIGFMSVNPARWTGNDLGMPDDVQTALEKGYGRIFESELRADQAERARARTEILADGSVKDLGEPSQADYEKAHERALAKFKPIAQQMMVDLLARHQTRMFSREEMRDIAMVEVARDEGLAADVAAREFVDVNGKRVSFDDFVARDGVNDRIEANIVEDSNELYRSLTEGLGAKRMLERSEDNAITVADTLTIPKDLPTARQAVLARVLRNVPALRTVMMSVEADPNRSIDDQLGGMATRGEWLQAISSAVVPTGTISSSADLEEAYRRIEDVDPAILESVARDLGYTFDGTKEGLAKRNRRIARQAILATASADPDVRVFTRLSTLEERDDRFGSAYGHFSPARRMSNGKWAAVVYRKNSSKAEPVEADTPEQLAEFLARPEFGYTEAKPKLVYTSARVLQSDDALSMIRSLNLGKYYRERMNQNATDNNYLDPLARVGEDGQPLCKTEAEANAMRERERVLSDLFESRRKQLDPALYLREGESATDESAMKRANLLMLDAKACWYRRNGRNDRGEAQGYIATADDLLRQYQVTVPHSAEGNAFGVALQSLRGKYSINIRAIRDVGATGNVYVPINHGSAQDYESALLEGALLNAYARNRAYIDGAFDSTLKNFMDDASRVMQNVSDTMRKNGNEALADKIDVLRNATVARSADQVRKPSPTTFAMFASAFSLYRTEVDKSWLTTVLGPHAAALAAVAPQIRQLPSFIGFTSVVDRVLGGAGFETDLLGTKDGDALMGRGILRMYALFAPEGSKTLAQRIAESVPGGSYEKFVEKAANLMNAAVRPKFIQKFTRPARQPAAPLDIVKVVNGAAEASGMTPMQVVNAVRASENAGVTAPEVPAPAPSAPASESGIRIGTEDDEDDDISISHEDDAYAMGPAVTPVAGVPVTPVAKDNQALLPSEVNSLVDTFVSLAAAQDGTLPDAESFEALVRKLIPDVRSVDMASFLERFNAKRDKAPVTSVWGDEPDNEEGVLPDGHDGNNSRAVEMLKSKALSNFLAMMNLVSPSTGRDFQPFVEDLRSLVAASSYLNPDATGDLAEATEYLRQILNPRAETSVANAPGRDSVWRHRISRLDPKSSGFADIRRYVRAFLGAKGEPAVNGRAALLLTYLASVPSNVRMQMASLVASSAPASPLRVNLSFASDETGASRPVFLASPVSRKGGHTSMGTITSSFGRFSGKDARTIEEAADRLESEFEKAVAAGELSGSIPLFGRERGIFNTYARILAPVFGADSPLVSMLVSRSMASRLRSDFRDAQAKGNTASTDYVKFVGFFSSSDGTVPSTAKSLVETLRAIAREVKASRDTERTVADLATELFQSGPRSERNVFGSATSLQGGGVWHMLMRAYSDAKPVTVMTTETDPERTSRPASSLAITMCGIEPALQEFLDRSDKSGFRSVLREWFPAMQKLSDAEFDKAVADYRQRLIWPSLRGDTIVAKSISKSALATETLAGCRTAFEYETKDTAPQGYVRRNLVFVPVYSGDHSSSILIQVPLAKEFAAKGWSYDRIAETVSSWVGLDLLGTDAKRSAVTCLEAPGTSMFDYVYDGKGNVVKDETGKPVQGHAYVSIVWNSDPEANNEAMIGTTGIVGYGATRQQEMSKNPGSRTVKCHIAAVGEDEAYGPALTLIKSLAVVKGSLGTKRGEFVVGSPLDFLEKHALKFIEGQEDISTVTYTDFDSVKLGVANSKTIFAGYDSNGDPVPLMQYVFGRVRDILDGKVLDENGQKIELGDTVTTEQLDRYVGEIEWTNLGKSGKSGRQLLSQLLPGAVLREVKRDGDFGNNRMFSLTYRADNQMAFQVANVSHDAETDRGRGRTPRNYMLDSLAMSRVLRTWNADVASGLGDASVFANADGACRDMRDLVSAWGFISAAISSDEESIRNILADDEEFLDMLARGEPANGDYAEDFRRRAFASWARKNNLNVPINGIDAPLVTNAGWFDGNGNVRSHSSSRMFLDTLRGARTIAKSDRGFWRGHKRSAICNVNCNDVSFRYGMYIEDGSLEAKFPEIAAQVAQEEGALSGAKLAAAILDRVVTGIQSARDGQDPAKYADWDKKLAECLFDHHGVKFSERRRTVRRKARGEDGKLLRDADGNVIVNEESRFLYSDVSFLDLFTNATSPDGSRQFDRTAVYESMFNDATKKSHVYLGGTLMGLPRTPSYNGSMWLQTVRAGLPVTENWDEVAKQWSSGRDAMVAPDPFTLAILGCDHDGDKTKLYMLMPGRADDQQLRVSDLLATGIDGLVKELHLADKSFDGLFPTDKEKLRGFVKTLADKGLVEYDSRRERRDDGTFETIPLGLRLTAFARRGINNLFVGSLFDMNRMLPVMDDAGDRPFYTGPVSDGDTNRGACGRMTKATVAPKRKQGARTDAGSWDSVKKSLGPKVLDAEKGAIIGRPDVAAEVQTGAAVAAEARAIIVSMASSLHFAYMSGLPVGPFNGRNASAADWLDFMYHVDGLSNMTFDDIKEQVCSRLGVRPEMIETLIADIINSAPDGSLPTTDTEFMGAINAYGREVNREESSRWMMARASDPADYGFRRIWYEAVTGNPFAGKALPTEIQVRRFLGLPDRGRVRFSADKRPASGLAAKVWDWANLNDKHEEYAAVLSAAVRAGTRIKQPMNGIVLAVERGGESVENLAKWFLTVRDLKKARAFGNALNYMHVDPASNTSAEEAERLGEAIDFEQFEQIAADQRRAVTEGQEVVNPIDIADLDALKRMRAGTAIMYGNSIGEVIAARGLRDRLEFEGNRSGLVERFAKSSSAPGKTTREALLVSALHAAPLVAEGDAMALEANEQSVGWALAAFKTVRPVNGSRINASNAYEVLETIGRALAAVRHPDTKGTNVTFDVCYGIESMLDVVGRFVTDTVTHAKLPVFDYLREVPNANAWNYTPDAYGPAAEGLSRIVLSMANVSDGQISHVRSLFERVINGELDGSQRFVCSATSDGLRGSFVTDSAGHKHYAPKGLSFTLSTENLKAMLKFASSQSSKTSPSAKQQREGTARDVVRTIEQLQKVFAALDAKFGKGFAIEPSALLGQLLPLYSAITERVTGVPDATTSMLATVMPGVYGTWARELAQMRTNPYVSGFVSMATAVDYSPAVAVSAPEEISDDVLRVDTSASVKSLRTKSQVGGAISVQTEQLRALAQEMQETDERGYPTAKAKLARRRFFALSKKAAYGEEKGEEVKDPRFRHTLSIFDGVRGVVFRNTLAAVNGQLAEEFNTAKQTPVRQTYVKPAPATPVAKPAEPAVVAEPAVAPAAPAASVAETAPVEKKLPAGYDEYVAGIADRLGCVMKMWDCGRVEYNGGSTITVVGKLHVAGTSEPYETRVVIDVKPQGEELLSDEQIRERLNGRLYRQSLAVASGKTEAEIDAMPKDELFELAKKYRPTGRSRTFMPGTESGVMREVGEWRLSADMIGVLTGRIELARREEDPDVIYHEYFHSVMGFMRELGAFSEEDVKHLVKKYGKSAKYGDSWFNEETAAEAFKAFAEGRYDPKDSKDASIWNKIYDFLTDLFDVLFYAGRAPTEAYENEMAESPLAYLMLTGCSLDTVNAENLDFEGKVERACMTRFRHLAALRKELDALPPKDPRRKFFLEKLNGTMFTGIEAGFEYQIDDYLRLVDEGDGKMLPSIDKPGDRIHGVSQPGVSILENEKPEELGYSDLVYTRECMILQLGAPELLRLDDEDIGVERLVRFGRFLNRLSVIGREGERYGELMGPELMRKARAESVAALVKEYGQEGKAFARAYRKFMTICGPSETEASRPATVPEAVAQSASVTETVPNGNFEGSIDRMMASIPVVMESASDDFEPSHFGLEGDDAYAMAKVHPEVRETLRTVAPDRMNVPYPKMNALAREIGRAIRANLADLAPETSAALTRCQSEARAAQETAVAEAAVRQVGALYGIDALNDGEVRKALFRAVYELHGMVKADREVAAGGEIAHAAADRGVKSETARDVTPAVLSAAIATSTGVRPCDMANAAIETIDGIAERYGKRSTFVLNVVNPLKSVLRRVASADPTHLVEDAGYREDTIGTAISAIRSGLVKGGLLADGSWADFELATEAATDNADSAPNIQRYADHIGNPDFHKAVHAALDAVHMVGGAMRYCRTIGFEPGSPEDAMFLKGLDPNMPEPLSVADMAAADAVAPEQMQDPSFDFDEASYFDQPYFTARHPEEWLDSVMRPQFGTVNIREHFTEERRAIAGFHTRSVQQGNLDARTYGLDVLPGQALTAIEGDYETSFEMKGGKVLRKAKGRKAVKFSGYSHEPARDANGREIRMTLTDSRRCDLVLKARKCWAQGGQFVLTGVDGLTFAPTDSHDPKHYSWEEVRKREEIGIAGGYSDLDRVLVRLHRQFSDDLSEPWSDIVGADGLNVYDRLVNSACKALEEAKQLMNTLTEEGRPYLTAREVNDYVLKRLDREGLVASAEAYVTGLGRTARTKATVKLSVDEIERMFLKSDTYKKLLKAGRTEKMLSRESYVKPHMDLFREVKEFVAAHPYLSDGDGAYFHNVSTPLPFVKGSGFFMYAANRVERDSQASVHEAMSVWEKAFYDLVGREGMTPATSATADQLRLLRTLFHLEETDAESVRSAMIEGRYENVEGLRLGAASTVRDLGLAIYNRLVGMTWKKGGDPTLETLGGHASVARMLKFYEKNREADQSVVAGGVGMTDELVYRMSGTLPANHQLGHAVQNAIDGITNGYAFRAALFNMLTTPDEDGMPVCYARPSDNAEETGGLPDQLWGTVARWWAQLHGLDYDPAQTGVQNARRIYDAVRDTMKDGCVAGKKFGSLKDEEIDARSIQGFMARAATPEEESKLGFLAGGYAMGYAKHLFQSSRGLGPAWVRKSIHRAWAYSKGLSVSFSYFFPLATRFESPVGAVGALATLGGNFSPEALRNHAETFAKLQSIFRGKGWITKDFLGQRDVMDMLDSNDPFLAELYHWAGCLGISLSDSNVNPQEHSRGMMQEDLKNTVAYIRRTVGVKAAAQVDSIMKALLTRSGDRAFTYHLNATKLAVTAQICARLQIEAAKSGKAFDPVRDLKRYSGYINAEIGGIDPIRYAWAHPGARNLMNAMFFSWEWTRGAWEAGGGTVLEQILFGGHDVTAQERKYLIGRAARMGLEVMVGLPMMLQVMSKALGLALVAGLDPDDPELTEEQRRRIRQVLDTPWFTWQNEDKTWMSAFDITPIMAGVAARFPDFAKSRANHALLYGLGALGAMVTPGRGLALKLLKTAGIVGMTPVYTGTDAANQKTRGRRYYEHFGKQGWEFFRWFTDPVGQFMSKLSMPVQRMAEGVMGRSLTWLDHPLPWDDQGAVERWINPSWKSAWFNLCRAFVPFSVSSLVDTGDAGFLPLFGPVQMGRSSSKAIEEMAVRLDRWSSNDRRGYAFGGMSRKAGQKYSRVMARNDVTIAHVLAEAQANGYSEKDSYELVDTALRRLTSSLYGKILDEMPTTADGDFDEDALGRLLRKANRLGRFRHDMYESLMNRMKAQHRWQDVSPQARRRIDAILRASKRTPYRPLSEAIRENGYDY